MCSVFTIHLGQFKIFHPYLSWPWNPPGIEGIGGWDSSEEG